MRAYLFLLLLFYNTYSFAQNFAPPFHTNSHYNPSFDKKDPCNNPSLNQEEHLYCKDFQAFLQQAHNKKSEWYIASRLKPGWKKAHDNAEQQVRIVQKEVENIALLLQDRNRPTHIIRNLEETKERRIILLQALQQVAKEHNFKELYETRYGLDTTLMTATVPLICTGIAWWLYGMPVYTPIKAGLNDKLSDNRDINREHSWWSTASTVATMTRKVALPYALATGETKWWIATGVSTIGFPIAYRAALNARVATVTNNAEIILSPNAQIATGCIDLMTWGPLLYNICAHAYYMHQLKSEYPFKEEPQN